MGDGPDETRFACILAAGLVIACMIPCTPADGQDDPARVNAAAAIGELGWRAADDAYAAIVEVHVRRASAQGMRPETMARLYSAAMRRPRRAWVPELARPGRPPSWPAPASWRRHAARFASVLEVVRATLAGERVEACPGAMHYGSATLDPVPRGHVEACRWGEGRRAQSFYVREERDDG